MPPSKRKLKTESDETPSSSKKPIQSKYFNKEKKSTDDKLPLDVTNKSKERLKFPFFDLPCEDLAKSLLGQRLVTLVDGQRLSGLIVETEAYLGLKDKAAHSYNGKRSARNEAMFMPPGTSYVYNIYGMYCCMNISSRGDGEAVLIRAIEPVENLPTMSKFRSVKGKDPSVLLKKDGRGLGNGPSKLCQALAIKKDVFNQADLCKTTDIWLEKGDRIDEKKIVKCKRININYAEDWVDKPLRFYIHGNEFVSVRDKAAE